MLYKLLNILISLITKIENSPWPFIIGMSIFCNIFNIMKGFLFWSIVFKNLNSVLKDFIFYIIILLIISNLLNLNYTLFDISNITKFMEQDGIIYIIFLIYIFNLYKLIVFRKEILITIRSVLIQIFLFLVCIYTDKTYCETSILNRLLNTTTKDTTLLDTYNMGYNSGVIVGALGATLICIGGVCAINAYKNHKANEIIINKLDTLQNTTTNNTCMVIDTVNNNHNKMTTFIGKLEEQSVKDNMLLAGLTAQTLDSVNNSIRMSTEVKDTVNKTIEELQTTITNGFNLVREQVGNINISPEERDLINQTLNNVNETINISTNQAHKNIISSAKNQLSIITRDSIIETPTIKLLKNIQKHGNNRINEIQNNTEHTISGLHRSNFLSEIDREMINKRTEELMYTLSNENGRYVFNPVMNSSNNITPYIPMPSKEVIQSVISMTKNILNSNIVSSVAISVATNYISTINITHGFPSRSITTAATNTLPYKAGSMLIRVIEDFYNGIKGGRRYSTIAYNRRALKPLSASLVEVKSLKSSVAEVIYSRSYNSLSRSLVEPLCIRTCSTTPVIEDEFKYVNNKKEEIIKIFESNVIITNKSSDYILINDILKIYKDLNYKNFNIIKVYILEYLKYNVNNILRKGYKGVVIPKYNKRAYIGIKFIDDKRLINQEIYNDVNILFDQNNVENKIEEIKWTPRDQIKYLNKKIDILEEKLMYKLNIIENLLKVKEYNIEEVKVITNNKNEKEPINEIKQIIIINESFFKENLIYTNNKKDYFYTQDLINKYKIDTTNQEKNKFYNELRQYILKEYCENDINKFKSLQYRGTDKRGYCCMIIKRTYVTIKNGKEENYKVFKVKDVKNQSIEELFKEKIELSEKQYKIEQIIKEPLDLKKYFKIFDEERYNLAIKEINNYLNSDKFITIGKRIINKFYEEFPKKLFIDLIIVPFIFMIKYSMKKFYSINVLRDLLKDLILNFVIENNLRIEQSEGKENYYDLISSYFLELLKNAEILDYDFQQENYIVRGLLVENIEYSFQTEDLIKYNIYIYLNMKWPLLIEPKDYNNMYEGGYYLFNNKLRLSNDRVKDIELKERGLKLINEYQKIVYYLNINPVIIKLLEQYVIYLYNKIKNEKEEIKSYYDFKEAESQEVYKKDIFIFKIESTMELWYALHQYLIMVKNNINKIYFTYQIDFRGRIYNNIFYGFNPTNSKITRLLINTGIQELTEEGKNNLKKYIYNKLKITTEEEFQNKLNKIEILIKNDVLNTSEEMFNNIEEYILLIDWITNVKLQNKTEIMIELDANQSGFQMLSMFSNDIKGFKRTGLIESNESIDLYTDIYNRIILEIEKEEIQESMISKKKKEIKKYYYKFKKENIKILNRKLIKKVIMTIPYGSKIEGQIKMLIKEFNKNYSLKLLFDTNQMPKILECKIINDNNIIKKIEKFNNILIEDKYKNYKNFHIYEQIAYHQAWLEMDLRLYFFRVLSKLINKEVKDEYPIIIKFVNELKKDFNKNINKYDYIETEYFKISILYYKCKEYNYTVQNKKYRSYLIDKTKIDKIKTTQGLIANLCHGLGDSFILYNILENLLKKDIKCYTIHDAILCNSNSVNIIQNQVLESYKYVYKYINRLNIFDFINKSEEYEINSLKIFNIK